MPSKVIPGSPFQETRSHSGKLKINPADPGPKWAPLGPGPHHLGLGPTWTLGPLGRGPHLDLEPTWALAHLGPGPTSLGPEAHLGPGHTWTRWIDIVFSGMTLRFLEWLSGNGFHRKSITLHLDEIKNIQHLLSRMHAWHSRANTLDPKISTRHRHPIHLAPNYLTDLLNQSIPSVE